MSKDRTPAELASDFAALARAATSGGAQPSGRLTRLLHIGEEQLFVLSGSGATPETVRQIELGASRIARDFFRHDPPTSQEIERAIDFAEDEIMRLGRPADAASTLWVTASALGAWRDLSGPTLTIDRVELWFQRLASASLGQPGTMSGLPSGREAAATLLVLREFMHHQGYAAIVVEPPVR